MPIVSPSFCSLGQLSTFHYCLANRVPSGIRGRQKNAVETEQQYMRQALKDNQETTRFLITGFAALMVLIQVISSVMQARREDRAYVKQARREDELEQRRVKRENELETLRRQREDELDARRSQREQQLFTFWTEREKQLDQRRVEREDRLDAMSGSSVQSVKNVLDVVYNTFEERRKAEEEGRQAARNFNDRIKELTDTIDTLNTKINDLEGFAAGVRRTVDNERHTLERRDRRDPVWSSLRFPFALAHSGSQLAPHFAVPGVNTR